jgi:hypothetical protein
MAPQPWGASASMLLLLLLPCVTCASLFTSPTAGIPDLGPTSVPASTVNRSSVAFLPLRVRVATQTAACQPWTAPASERCTFVRTHCSQISGLLDFLDIHFCLLSDL